MTDEQIRELAQLLNINNLETISIKKLKSFLPSQIEAVQDVDILNELISFKQKYEQSNNIVLKPSENKLERFNSTNLNELLENNVLQIIKKIPEIDLIKSLFNQEEINKIKLLADEELNSFIRQLAYYKASNKETKKNILPIIKAKLNGTLNVEKVNSQLLKIFERRFKSEYGLQTDSKNWSGWMKEFYPEFKPENIRKEYNYATPNIIFSVESNPLTIGLTQKLKSKFKRRIFQLRF